VEGGGGGGGGGVGALLCEAYTARDKADCCICLETLPQVQ